MGQRTHECQHARSLNCSEMINVLHFHCQWFNVVADQRVKSLLSNVSTSNSMAESAIAQNDFTNKAEKTRRNLGTQRDFTKMEFSKTPVLSDKTQFVWMKSQNAEK